MTKNSNNELLLNKIKKMPVEKLQVVADALREELIEDVSKTGGHLASNLGVVELTIALDYVFDVPKDKLIFDVGHQCYVHKMLTGRRDAMSSIRQYGGISGFPKISESEYDMYDSGHSGTSISAALGYARARDLAGENYACVAVIGDGALTSGVAWEAINDAGSSKTPLIIILNDNQMSIDGSVGATSKYLNKLRTSQPYISFKNAVKNSSANIPAVYKGLENVRDAVKSLFVDGGNFEEFGFKYYGPIDGHNIPELVRSLKFAKNFNEPIILHVMTKKGKGFKPAEENPTKYHGIGSFNIETADSKPTDNSGTWSDIFGDELCNICSKDDKVVAVSAAMIEGTGLSKLRERYPKRLFDVGITEQHAVAMAAGMALNGFKPVVAIYSTFLQRAYDEIITEVCLMNLPVVFAIDRAGVTGNDGETHQGVFDIAYLSSMPNMTILNAADERSFRKALNYAVKLGTPCAIRYGKGKAPDKDILDEDSYKDYKPGNRVLKQGSNAILITDALFYENCIKASELLKNKGHDVALCLTEQIKPFDKEFYKELIAKYDCIVTIEDAVFSGGIGSQINTVIAENSYSKKIRNLCWPDKFIEHGSIGTLRKAYKLNPESIANLTEELIENKA